MSFLDRDPPYPFKDANARDLWLLLARNYRAPSQIDDLLVRADLEPADFNMQEAPKVIWRQVLLKAHSSKRLRGLLQIVGDEDEGLRTRLQELTAETPVTSSDGAASSPVTWKNFGSPELERIIRGDSTLLDISFLDRGLELSRAVCRLSAVVGDRRYIGTGFRIGDDLILTNHHVLFVDGKPCDHVEAWFNYERSFDGADREKNVIVGDPSSIVGEPTHDWAILRAPKQDLAEIPKIKLIGASPPRVDDRVYIIQHPQGEQKKIGMVHNLVRYVNGDVVQYLTDTDAGSSGSPVFNERWELVALHHKWTEEAVSGGVGTELRNQGRRVERVVAGLVDAAII